MVPHVAARKNASAALRIFVRHPKKTFSTISARSGSHSIAPSTLPTGFSEAVEHVGVLFWPEPGRPLMDLKLERCGRNRDRFLQRIFRFGGSTEFAESGGEPAVMAALQAKSGSPSR